MSRNYSWVAELAGGFYLWKVAGHSAAQVYGGPSVQTSTLTSGRQNTATKLSHWVWSHRQDGQEWHRYWRNNPWTYKERTGERLLLQERHKLSSYFVGHQPCWGLPYYRNWVVQALLTCVDGGRHESDCRWKSAEIASFWWSTSRNEKDLHANFQSSQYFLTHLFWKIQNQQQHGPSRARWRWWTSFRWRSWITQRTPCQTNYLYTKTVANRSSFEYRSSWSRLWGQW